MKGNNRNIEFSESLAEGNGSRRGSIRDFIDGRVLTREVVVKQLPFIIFVVLLAILYIGNRYHAEKVVRQTVILQNQVKELRSEAITTSAQLMSKSRQSEVLKMIEENGLGLKELVEPPGKIVIKRK